MYLADFARKIIDIRLKRKRPIRATTLVYDDAQGKTEDGVFDFFRRTQNAL